MKNISDFYTIEEVREGFFVPTEIKQAWASELEVLIEIDRVCQKYDISYFADWGTLLGAVRHGGFIPWDDDLDICMKRADYQRFLSVASKELEEGFFVQTYENMDPDNWLFMGKVVGKNHICFEKEHLKRFHNFPYIACVDIFVLDYVYKDEEKEAKRRELCLYLLALADSILASNLNSSEIQKNLEYIEKKWKVKLCYVDDSVEIGRGLYREVERQFGLCNPDEAVYLSQLFPWGLKGKGFLLQKEFYDKSIRLPFEGISIPVPYAYDSMLRKRYGDYLHIVKEAGAHEYPFFEAQKERFFSYAGFRLPEYRLLDEDGKEGSIEKTEKLEGKSLKDCVAVYLDELEKGNESLNDLINVEAVQQMAIELGTLIENVRGEGHFSVRVIEGYCEELYRVYQNCADTGGVSSLDRNILKATFAQVKSEVMKTILEAKTILFMLVHASDWKCIKDIFDRCVCEENAEIFVFIHPYYFKEFDGTPVEEVYEIDELIANREFAIEKLEENNLGILVGDRKCIIVSPDKLTKEYLEFLQPDIIFHTNPYDSWNPAYSVLPQYYSNEIKKYTRELIYINPYRTDEFSKKDGRDYKNMNYYVTRPGVINSDLILLQNTNMVENYIGILPEFCGIETTDEWIKKVKTVDEYLNDIRIKKCCEANDNETFERKATKKLLYLTSLGCFFENEEKAIRKIESTMEIFLKQKERIEVSWAVYPILPKESEECFKLQELIEKYCKPENNIEFIDIFESKNNANSNVANKDINVGRFDAYYGDGSFLVHRFRRANKPVMIQNYDI